MIGTDQAHISRIERGERMEMSIQTLEKLADALEVSTDFLLGRTDLELSMSQLSEIVEGFSKEVRLAEKHKRLGKAAEVGA